MKSQQYPYEVNVLSKKVNHLRKGGQPFPDEQVNFFRMDRQMLKNKGWKESTIFRKRQKLDI